MLVGGAIDQDRAAGARGVREQDRGAERAARERLRLVERASAGGWLRVFDRQEREIEAGAVDEFVADPEFEGEAAHFSCGHQRLREVHEARALDLQDAAFVGEGVFDLIGGAELFGIRGGVIGRRGSGFRRRR